MNVNPVRGCWVEEAGSSSGPPCACHWRSCGPSKLTEAPTGHPLALHGLLLPLLPAGQGTPTPSLGVILDQPGQPLFLEGGNLSAAVREDSHQAHVLGQQKKHSSNLSEVV